MFQVRRTLKSAAVYGVAACVLLQMLLALALAVSPDLHEQLHHDAGSPFHDCAVTHLIHGDFGDAVPVPLITAGPPQPAPEAYLFTEARAAWVQPLFLANGVLEHAPPMFG